MITNEPPSSPRNLTNILLSKHRVSGELVKGSDLRVDVDQVLLEDATGTMSAMQFEMLSLDRVNVPLAVVYIDHNVLQIDDKNMQDHRYLQTFSERYGLRYSPPGHGISHYIHLEHFARPGDVLVGADSHTSMAGAVGMFATGAGGLEVAVAMGGYGFDFPCPSVTGVELTGALQRHVAAKDIVLELLRRYGVRGGRGTVFEFYGSGVAGLTITERATICNMIVETGATTAVFPSDQETLRWLTSQGRADDYVPLSADLNAEYDAVEHIDLDLLEPLVAVPHSPGDVVRVAEVSDVELVQVCVGSSVNSSYEDLATVASILRGHRIHPRIQLTVTPGSKQVLDTIISSGVYQDLMAAGARMLEPICGPCVGIGQAPLGTAPSLRTFNRNFPGRSGTADDQVYLCSPATAAASALTGRITNPRAVEVSQPLRNSTPPDPQLHGDHITRVLDEQARTQITVDRGPNLVPPKLSGLLSDRLQDKVLIVVGDDISTGDMAPDGTLAMSVWSNIDLCAQFMFNRLDRDFHDRARSWGGGLIIAGENYGQGSSREHAALIPVQLGVKAIVAKSYARIHRRNLIAVGVLPLLLPDLPEATSISVGDEWTIDGLREAVISGQTAIAATTAASVRLNLGLDLTVGERTVVLAGGLLSAIRQGHRSLIASAAAD